MTSNYWEIHLADAIEQMLVTQPYIDAIPAEHTEKTPVRVVAAYKEMLSGCLLNVPKLLTEAMFSEPDVDEMIHVKDAPFFSCCAHHLVPFFGKMYFAYIPNGYVVGLSKIPRALDAFARRPQVQERLTYQIVNCFMEHVKPRGCAVMIRAAHLCMMCRGVKSPAYTETTALRGNFQEPAVKQEFLASVNSTPWSLL